MSHSYHIAIIPDGNRRWSKHNKSNLEKVYYQGCLKVLNFCSILFKEHPEVHEISIFFVSLENLRFRKSIDLDPLFKAGLNFIDDFNIFAEKESVELNWIGIKEYSFSIDSNYFYDLKEKITSSPVVKLGHRKLNVLFGYDVEKDINDSTIENGRFKIENLQVKSQVNFIIRSGGKHRLSGFLPLNTLYSELYVYDKFFPEIEISDIQSALEHYISETKNYGL